MKQSALVTRSCAAPIAVAAMLIGHAVAGQSADPALTPSTKWNLDYSNDQCTLARNFGSENKKLLLATVLTPGYDVIDVIVMEMGQAGGASRRAKLVLANPAAPAIEAQNAVGAAAKDGGRVTRGSIGRAQLDQILAGTVLNISIDGRSSKIELAGASGARKAMDSCEKELFRKQGVDPAALARIKVKPTPANNPSSWGTDNDYPAAALQKGEQGTVIFRFDIDITGKVTNCVILRSSGSKSLDYPVCTRMAPRARFNPARDDAGVAVPSIFVSRFNWRIPR